MTDVELAVESYLSISLVTYLSDIEWLTSFLQRNCLYIYRYDMECYVDPTYKLWYRNDIIMAYFPRLRCWSPISDIERASFSQRNWICRSRAALPLMKLYRNGVFSLLFANEVGRYLSDIEWSTWCWRGIPSYRYSSDVDICRPAWHSVADIRVMSK